MRRKREKEKEYSSSYSLGQTPIMDPKWISKTRVSVFSPFSLTLLSTLFLLRLYCVCGEGGRGGDGEDKD